MTIAERALLLAVAKYVLADKPDFFELNDAVVAVEKEKTDLAEWFPSLVAESKTGAR